MHPSQKGLSREGLFWEDRRPSLHSPAPFLTLTGYHPWLFLAPHNLSLVKTVKEDYVKRPMRWSSTHLLKKEFLVYGRRKLRVGLMDFMCVHKLKF
ncbi:hypothetical protein JTE90_029466 [Oedothorax gibbosus]|uniref:Uncharacterized protein n=1 Tax=Oedothorax gibbosus TaxID=931172 RepID=A0AAV6V522_9ARAC|nr:hypothetical protein JTE90_029466 [Oedothorax gibbosus]